MMGDGAFQNGHRSAPGTPKAGRKSVGPKNNLAVESTSEDRTEVESRLQRFIIGVLDYEAIKLGAAALYISPERSLSVDKFSTDIAGAFDLLTRNVVLQTWVDLLKGPVENPSLFPIEAAIQRKWKELLKNAPIELVEQAETTFLSSYVRIFRPRNFFIFCKPLLLIEGQPWEFFVTNRCVKLVAVSPEEEEAIIKLKQTKKHSAQDEFDFADLALINLNLSRPNYEEIARKVVSNRLSLQEGQLPPSMEDQRPRPNLSEAAYAALGSFQEILYEKCLTPNANFDQLRRRFIQNISRMLEIHYRQLNIKPHLFGSSVNGLGFAWSDVDVTFEIMSPEQYDKDEMDEWTSMHRLARALRNWGMKKVLPIPGARVQICKFFDPSTRMHCDANFGNLLGVHNSHLLATYCALDRRVKPLIMLLKLWAVNRDLNDPSGGGTISSYAYALMMINFLQIRGILPSLQALYDGQERVLLNVPKPKPRMNQYRDRRRAVKEERQQRRDQERIEKDKEDMADGDYDNLYEKGEEVEALIPPPKNIVHTADVTFLRDFSHASLLPYKERFEASTSYDVWSGPVGVAALFYQFLHYHAWEFIYRPNHVVSVRTGTVLSETPATLSEWKRKLGLILVVEDPFQLSHNTTGGVRDPSKVILEMRRALVLMQKAERDGCDAQEIMRRVLEETKEVSAKADANKEVLHQKLEELWSIDLRNGNVKKTSRSASARSKAPPSGSLRGSRDVSMGKRSTDVKSTVARETSFVDSRRDGKSSEFDLRKDATRIRDDRKPAVNGKSSEVDLPRNATRIRDNFKTEVHGVRAVAVDQSSRPSSSSTGTPKSKSGTSSKKNWRDNHEEAASVDKLTRSMSALRVENHESREDVGRELMVEINGATRAIRRRSAKPLQNPGPAPRSPEPTIRYELNGLYMSPRSTEGDGLPRDRSLRKSKSAQIHAQRGSGVFPATDWRYGADTPTATIHAQRVSPATDWKYGADTPTATGQQQQYTRICRKCRKSGHIARECTYVGG